MKVDVSMTTQSDMFEVQNWWAKSPDFVLASLQKQLQAASAIWPELAGYRLTNAGTSRKGEAGKAGGAARAATLTPERRSEIASEAAKARWGTEKETVA